MDQLNGEVRLSQTKYIEELVSKFAPDAANGHILRDVPMTDASLAKLRLAVDDIERERARLHPYLALVGSLLYVSTMTRPDVAYALSQLCQCMHDPSPECYGVAITVLLYLYKTRDLKLSFKKQYDVPECFRKFGADIRANDGLYAYSDSSWGVPKPVYGYVLFYGSGVVSYCTKKLKSADSSCEAEYDAANHCSKELCFVRNVLDDLGFPLRCPVVTGVDNTAAIDVANDRGVSARNKHYDRAMHFIREMIENLYCRLLFVPTAMQVADIFTKCLDKTTFLRFRNAFFSG